MEFQCSFRHRSKGYGKRPPHQRCPVATSLLEAVAQQPTACTSRRGAPPLPYDGFASVGATFCWGLTRLRTERCLEGALGGSSSTPVSGATVTAVKRQGRRAKRDTPEGHQRSCWDPAAVHPIKEKMKYLKRYPDPEIEIASPQNKEISTTSNKQMRGSRGLEPPREMPGTREGKFEGGPRPIQSLNRRCHSDVHFLSLC